MKKVISLIALGLALGMGSAYAASHAGAAPMKGSDACEKSAADKKLAGAAKTSHIKKCMEDSGRGAAAACEKSAADKKLAGAAKTSHMKKCMEDAKPAADAKPADAKPAAKAAEAPKK